MSKVSVKLLGGLGNQMFQYATARALAYQSGAELILDISWYNIAQDREFALNSMNIIGKVQNNKPSKFISSQFIQKIILKIRHFSAKHFFRENIFRERFFSFEPEVLKLELPVYLDGYFQSEKYFHSIRDVITHDFTLTTPPNKLNKMMLDDMGKFDSICVHVRRGDYVANHITSSNHGLCSLEYYYLGLQKLTTQLLNPKCYIFSDDIEWVQSNFISNIPITIVNINSAKDAHEDIRLMSSCKHFIIANSSFSWWAAWLGQNPDKIVIAPKKWFNNDDRNTEDLIPKDWIRI